MSEMKLYICASLAPEEHLHDLLITAESGQAAAKLFEVYYLIESVYRDWPVRVTQVGVLTEEVGAARVMDWPSPEYFPRDAADYDTFSEQHRFNINCSYAGLVAAFGAPTKGNSKVRGEWVIDAPMGRLIIGDCGDHNTAFEDVKAWCVNGETREIKAIMTRQVSYLAWDWLAERLPLKRNDGSDVPRP
jgi:hypothetical protein